VNFRLSDEEYERVYCSCHAEGVRSVSDFARSSVLRRAEGEVPEALNVGAWLLSLSQSIVKLDGEITLILDWIKAERQRDQRAIRTGEMVACSVES